MLIRAELAQRVLVMAITPLSSGVTRCLHHILVFAIIARIKSATSIFGALRDSILCNKGVALEVKDRVYVALVLSSTVPLGGKPGLLFFRVAARSHASLEAATGVRNQTHRRRVLPGKHLQIEAHEAASANGGFLFSVHN